MSENYKLPAGIYLPKTVEELAQYIRSRDLVIDARLRRVSSDWLAAAMIRAHVVNEIVANLSPSSKGEG